MRFDILEAAISSLSSQRDNILVDINSIMNTVGYASGEETITETMASLLKRLSVLDDAIETGNKLHAMFTAKINEQTAAQIEKLQDALIKYPGGIPPQTTQSDDSHS